MILSGISLSWMKKQKIDGNIRSLISVSMRIFYFPFAGVHRIFFGGNFSMKNELSNRFLFRNQSILANFKILKIRTVIGLRILVRSSIR
ncbi:hypothetical protein LEP1GSC194_1977 [Leptospira alstonii serovar Sichuan str. 79601]|uniref:Uncharacterized protein n=1 Tax=Leptospira alstonii serovar Sichuan str. 79601 TaxID=1218565 RepID=M6DGR6_9LEPT|nr:hypothetical protein LEP1GSC194_1977 [Leptospira alstonii serovar Sichuan str. 79601]